MKKNLKVLLLSLVLLFGVGFVPAAVYADDGETEGDSVTAATSISLTPTNKTYMLASGSVYDDSFTVTNDSDSEMRVNVYAAPYSFVYSEEEDLYKLGYTHENDYTQIIRWITIKNDAGDYEENPTFVIPPHESIDIEYRITTPGSIPAGGQYAVIFAHTLTSVTLENGIKTEASPGMIIYGRSTEGETIKTGEISGLEFGRGVVESGTTKNDFYATAKVKNTGNVDFNASGVLKAEPIIGFTSYETPEIESKTSIIPESERVVSDVWEDTPSFGIYKLTWTVSANGEEESIEKIVFLVSPLIVIVTIILLTILIIWVTIRVRRRKERRSRLAV